MSTSSSSLRAAALLALALPLGACSSQAPAGDQLSPEESARRAAPIAGGSADSESTAVVAIIDSGASGVCTGALIAPNLVLTAAHCIASAPEQVACGEAQIGSPSQADKIWVSTKQNLSSAPGQGLVQGSEIELGEVGGDICGADIALIYLAENISASDATPLLPRLKTTVGAGESYLAVGYGAIDGEGSSPFRRRQRAERVVECAGSACTYTDGGGRPLSVVNEFIGDVGICQGDSGGPAIDSEGKVAGVVSRGGVNCSRPIYAQVALWGKWLQAGAKKAATKGGYQAPSWALEDLADPTPGSSGGGAGSPGSAGSGGAGGSPTGSPNAGSGGSSSPCIPSCEQGAACVEGRCEQSGDPAPSNITNDKAPDSSCAIATPKPKGPVKPVPWYFPPALVLAWACARRRER